MKALLSGPPRTFPDLPRPLETSLDKIKTSKTNQVLCSLRPHPKRPPHYGMKILEYVELFSHVANLGDSHSLILHPASTTHRQLSEEQQISAGAGPEVIRLSIGIESVEDIISDLEQALNKL